MSYEKIKWKENGKLKLLIIVGTRPEIIRLAAVINKTRKYFDVILAHTGQNYDYNLNGVFFKDLKLADPEVYMNAVGADLGETMGNIIDQSYKLMVAIKPDAVLVLGDTNSCLSVIGAKRLHIPIFHMEAGNRCKDECLPEETNRRIVDIISDVNMAYSEHARRYLADTGLPKERTYVTGSPMAEVLHQNLAEIEASDIHQRLGLVHASDVVEINTYEQLRELDEESNHLKSDAISIIADVLKVSDKEVIDIEVLKKGMTNRSFLFTCRNKKYIMRIPGEGTDQLINRKEEAQVYQVIKDRGICDDIVYINPDNGYKITAYLEGARVCNPEIEEDLKKCMTKLKEFHSLGLKVDHTFDIFGQMEFYETLWGDTPSIYRDYKKTKEKVLSLKRIIDGMDKGWCLTHIDAVPDNFLFVEQDGKEEIRLIDWEYAGMQDPHVDIAMFCIYSLYDRKEVDKLIDIYFEGNCSRDVRIKIYCYIAACGLLWSNWCEYKRNLGVEFGEYSLRQYRYAKDYYKIAMEELSNESR